MQIKKGNKITLSDNIEYIVLSKVNYKDNNYLYLTSIEKNPKIKICCEKQTDSDLKLLIVTDNELIQKLILLFANDVQSIL